jgi:transposase
MDMVRLNKVCDLYASGLGVKAIASEVGVSSKTIWVVLAQARGLGDVRARHRRVRGDAAVDVLMESFEAADGGYLGWEDFRMLLWGGEDVPATWRVVVRVGLTDCRKKYGVKIVHDRVSGGYRLVK